MRRAGCARAPSAPATAATALEPQTHATLHTPTHTMETHNIGVTTHAHIKNTRPSIRILLKNNCIRACFLMNRVGNMHKNEIRLGPQYKWLVFKWIGEKNALHKYKHTYTQGHNPIWGGLQLPTFSLRL